MTDIETRVTTLEQQVNTVMTKLDMFIEESRAARERRDAEMRVMNAKIDAKFDSIIAKLDDMDKHVRNITIAIEIGIAAMVVAVFLK